ncbi:MAG TPA: hypothetical protein VFQ53_19465 [Kofleriaceae bacterium]|nr:hypothetical protein [Kofleriaceae bacterium]
MRALAFAIVVTGCSSTAPAPAKPAAAAVALPGGEAGIGFDDLRFAPGIGRVLAPAGGTGNLDLVDPRTRRVTAIGGFGTADASGGHEHGTTSADEGEGLLFAIDRTKLALVVVDARTLRVVGQAALASAPDYVRWVAPTRELWVTEPDEDRLEVFALDGTTPKHTAFVAVKGGPESLVIDAGRRRAFTHLWDGATVAIDLPTRAIVASWPNGCTGSRGIALDAARGQLFVGCAEGKAVVLAEDTGKQLGAITVGAGVDVIDVNVALGHLYVPSAKTATLSIVAVHADGTLALLGTVPTAPGAHCVTADDRGGAWVCDVEHGTLLAITDPYPASR